MAPNDLPPDPAPETIRQHAAELGLQLHPSQAQALAAFGHLLQRWNRVHNLTARDSDEEILSHHLLDSLAIAPTLAKVSAGSPAAGGQRLRVLDAGAGAGLPGIPLAIACPRLALTLVDAVQKKCAFMSQARLELALPNVEVVHARLESFGAAPFDVIVSRAFATLERFTSLTRHLLKPGGLWLAMKGQRPDDELAELPPAVRVVDTVTLRVPRLSAARHLVLLRPANGAPEPQASPSTRGASPAERPITEPRNR